MKQKAHRWNGSSLFLVVIVLLVGLATILLFAPRALVPASAPDAAATANGYPGPEVTGTPQPTDRVLPTASIPVATATFVTVAPTPAKQDARGWFIYDNKLAGFSLTYPKEGIYAVQASETGITLVFDVKGASAWQGMTVAVQANPDKLDLAGFVDRYNQGFNPMSTPEPVRSILDAARSVRVGGVDAIEVKFPDDCGEFVQIVPSGQQMVLISLARGDCLRGPDPQQASLDLFNQIMGTFIFGPRAELTTP